jgi:hypothetical protein
VLLNIKTGVLAENGKTIINMKRSGLGKIDVKLMQTTDGNQFSFDLDGTSGMTNTKGAGGSIGPIDGGIGHENSISTAGSSTVVATYKFTKGVGEQVGTINIGTAIEDINDDGFNYKVEIDDANLLYAPTIIVRP